MPQAIKAPKFTDVKPIIVRYNTFARGLNTLVNATNIRDDELSVATNIILINEGAPTRRPGTQNYGNASGNTGTYGLYPYYGSNGTNALLKLEGGFLKKFNTINSNWDIISGGSFASGIRTCGVLAFDTLYLTNGTDPLSKYDGNGISVFAGITAPSSNWAVQSGSFASGQYLYSYRVTAQNNVGETTAAAAATISTTIQREVWNPDPNALTAGRSVVINWTTVPSAQGYNIYGVVGGDETYLGHVDGGKATSWVDYGTATPSAFFPVPVGNNTTGVRGKFVIEFKSSLMIAGDPQNPSRVYYSAGVDKIDSFLISDGGGFIDVSKNSDDGAINGLAKFQNNAVILKERSIWQLNFTTDSLPSLQNVANDIGCVSHFTIKNVENDLFFLGRKLGGGPAIYVLGNEPNYLNVLRTNELSTRVRPELLAIPDSKLSKTFASYFNGRYAIFYPEGSVAMNNTAIVYDRERLGFTKWSSIYADFVTVYYDASGNEFWLTANGNDNRITQIDESLTSDKGTAINWNVRTKETDLKDPFLYKKFKWVNLRIRNAGGTVRLKIITDGNTTAYQSSITAPSKSTSFRGLRFRVGGFRRTGSDNLINLDGIDIGGTSSASDTTGSSSYIVRRIPISRQGTVSIAKSLALEVYGDSVSSIATLLDVTIEARPKSKNFYPREEVISS